VSFTPRWRRPAVILQRGIYAAQIVHAAPATSHTSAEMIKLRLAVLPLMRYEPGYLTHYLVFNPKGDWTVGQFFASIGVKLLEGTCVSVLPSYCLHRIVYPEIIAHPDLKVARLHTREEALDKNPGLAAVRLPGNQPENIIPPILSKNL
jgi:hypothetical protein